jgi:hypothetical protein
VFSFSMLTMGEERSSVTEGSWIVMIISIYPHFLLYTNVNITLSNIAILFSISFLSIFLVCFVFTLFLLG